MLFIFRLNILFLNIDTDSHRAEYRDDGSCDQETSKAHLIAKHTRMLIQPVTSDNWYKHIRNKGDNRQDTCSGTEDGSGNTRLSEL